MFSNTSGSKDTKLYDILGVSKNGDSELKKLIEN